MAVCGYCNHSGYHAQFIPLGAEPSRRCGDCRPRHGPAAAGRPRCLRHASRLRVARRAQGDLRHDLPELLVSLFNVPEEAIIVREG